MFRKSFFTSAIVAMGLVVSAGQLAKADSTLALEGGYTNPITFDGTNFQLIDGDSYDPISYDSYPYTFDLNFSLDSGSAITTPTDAFGDVDIQGTFKGTYTFYVGSTVVSTGTASMQGDFESDTSGDFYTPPTFTDGIFTQTSGSGLDIFPGVTMFSFSGNNFSDGDIYFRGDISATAAPLPASAGMGLLLLAGLLPLAHRRRLMA